MSIAGIQSNRGDGYQTMVAFDWALTVLSDPDYRWIEIDSVSWSVDDVVIGKVDDRKICCQCKKNQTGFKAWSIPDISDELNKGISLLARDPSAVLRFYSRSNFGDLAALREYSTNFGNENDYRANLGTTHEKSDSALAKLIADKTPNLSTFEFLCRTAFVVSDDLDRMQTFLHERLRQLVSNPTAAFAALWTHLDHLGMRVNGNAPTSAPNHRLSKEDLKSLVIRAGAMLTPPMDLAEVRTSFQSTSAIGRSWRRDIGNVRISSQKVDELMAAIDAGKRSILLTGLPGSGKTCVMLALQEKLELRTNTQVDLVPLFIQSREFADFATAQEREVQGLSEHWVEKVARVAEAARVVVVIDSLDVLSIAREHSVLTYFLAQLDRLLLIPNVTVVTACRDFDRQYDRRIAQRTWDKSVTCEPLDWDTEIAPLLAKLGIEASTVEAATREVIRNPRELALYVDLAQKGGSFNVVTSQGLAQRYLATFIQADPALGNSAMEAIEAIAVEMLQLRSLAVQPMRFSALQAILQALLSHNVLRQTEDGQLTFGHQTLLDVLVISDARRRSVTLNEFIKGLPPVPFVRPSIRSFVEHLASGDRREYRKQVRAVLTGNHAFHVRRLVAECFAEQIPQNEDWALIRDIRNHHLDIFLVIYARAARIEWHQFWLHHLVPMLQVTRDGDGLLTHARKASQWKDGDPEGVFALWADVLALDWVDKNHLASQIGIAISDVQSKHSALLAPLLLRLLELPRQPHSNIGLALAKCAKGCDQDDAVLWRFITGEIRDDDVLKPHFDSKLHCRPHEFGNSHDPFLLDRMRQSIALLDLAVTDIERWSRIKASIRGEAPASQWSGFLRETSYVDIHDQTDHYHPDSTRILMDAVQAGIFHHATNRSDWWRSNRQRLCFSNEGALRYFAIVACTSVPIANLDLIGSMLCDRALLESDLSYELGCMMKAAYLHLDAATQDAIEATVLSLHQEPAVDSAHRRWIVLKQAELIGAIPRHLRSSAAQAVMDECEASAWPFVAQPSIGMRGGMVSAPFPYKVFLDLSDAAVVQLLAHYDGYAGTSFDEFLIGGAREVGAELSDAASRSPTRFIELLTKNWGHIANRFRDDILHGVATYLAYKYGNLQVNGTWKPVVDADPIALVRRILDELENHASHWHHNRSASKAINGCAHVFGDVQSAERLIALAVSFATLEEESPISGDAVDLLTAGINMARGNAAEALMILANQLAQAGVPWPDLLSAALRRYAVDKSPPIRAVMLRRLPFLQTHYPVLGWELFGLAMEDGAEGLWPMAEPCLYHAYRQRFDIVETWLERLFREGRARELETWGRICALAALSRQRPLAIVIADLKSLESPDAWRGAASVWANASNAQQHTEQCFAGLQAGLSEENPIAAVVARKFRNLCDKKSPLVATPVALLLRCFALLELEKEPARRDVFGIDTWLNAHAAFDPSFALEATEIYLQFVRRAVPYLFDHDDNLTQLLTRLFAQAEEQEESDGGAMLQRVVMVQDTLLALGVEGVHTWLKLAERP